jgi:hypothetical protein
LLRAGEGVETERLSVAAGGPANFAALAAQHGLDFSSIAPDSQQIMAGKTGRRMMTIGENPVAFIHLLAAMVSEYAMDCMAASLRVCQGTDAIILNSFALMGYHR